MIESIWSWFLHKYKQDCLGSFIIILNLPKLIMKKNYIFVQKIIYLYNLIYLFFQYGTILLIYLQSEFYWNSPISILIHSHENTSQNSFETVERIIALKVSSKSFFFGGKCSMFAFCSCSFIHKSQKVTSGQGELQALPPHDLVKSWKQFKWTQPIT